MIDDDDDLFSDDNRTEKQKKEDDLKWMRFMRKDNRIHKIQKLFKDDFVWVKVDGSLNYEFLYEVKRK